jgi:predicted cation transporter
MLIPGNIANIISAGRLKIRTKEWMAVGIPIGIVAMLLYFAVLSIFGA